MVSQNQHWLKFKITGFVLKNLLKWPEPEVHAGVDAIASMGDVAKKYGLKKILIVTDKILVELGHVQRATDSLEAAGVGFVLYDQVEPNPTIGMVEEGYKMYNEGGCDSILAFGGGSPMDCAKTIGCKVAEPKPVTEYTGGLDKWNKARYPFLVAVPTTAGTGSETTAAAVITNEELKQKIFVAGTTIIPKVAVLDPKVLVGLPKPVIAATGMDALTHAVESYVSSIAHKESQVLSLRAVERIFKHLKKAYDDGEDLVSREEMLQGSFEAGAAFTKSLLGYVHAIAHQFGGLYHTPHGVANAMILPKVLDHALKNDSSSATRDKYVELAFAAGIATRYKNYSDQEKQQLAEDFIAAVREMLDYMSMSQTVEQLKPEDVHMVTNRAIVEAMDGSPVPVYMTEEQCDAIVASFLPPGSAAPPPRSKL